MANKVQSDIRDFLKPLCRWVFVTTAGRVGRYTMAPKGMADIMAMTKRGKLLFIEVKAKGEVLSPEQADFVEWHAQMGYLSIVAHSVDDVEKYFRGLGWIS